MRFAPTPSGFLHRGNLLSFTLNWLWAQELGAQILLRIDDLDRARFRRQYLAHIFYSLDRLGLHWSQGPSGPDDFERHWSQARRFDLYRAALQRLRAGKQLFACRCSRKAVESLSTDGSYPGTCKERQLSFSAPGHAWRFAPRPERVAYRNWQSQWQWHPLPKDLQHVVLRRKNEQAAYQLASVVDDLHFGCSHILRGEDLRGSTLVQQAVATALGEGAFAQMHFAHHPLLSDAQGQKLSKSTGAAAVDEDPARFFSWLSGQWQLPEKAQNLSELQALCCATGFFDNPPGD